MSSERSESPSTSGQTPEKGTPPVDPPPVLARGSACHQCRKRKLKCDGHRPICNLCSKPRPKLNPNNEPPVCTWDELPDPDTASRRKRRQANDASSKKARIQELEDRVAAFEKAWKKSQDSAGTRRIKPRSVQRDVRMFAHALVSSPDPTRPAPPNDTQVPADVPVDFASLANVEDDPNIISMSVQKELRDEELLGDKRRRTGEFDLVSPDWSPHLPPLTIVEHIVQVFFARVPTLSKMIHKASFVSSIRLPPKHSRFPATALLHAILAITAPHLPESELSKREYFPIGTPLSHATHPIIDPFASPRLPMMLSPRTDGKNPRQMEDNSPVRSRFQQWHRRKALEEMADEVDRGGNMLQTVQAQILITGCDCQNGWWTEVWCEAGMCMRMVIPLMLHESSQTPEDSLQQKRYVVLPTTKDPLQQAIRDRTFWMAYLVERVVATCTAWPECLPDGEITVELPVKQDIFNSGVGQLIGTQTIHSADLYSNHPAHHADGLVLQIKALRLYSDVCRFFRRYARGSHSTTVYLQDPDLYKFLIEINTFRHSFPPHLRRPAQMAASGAEKSFDVDLFTTMMIVYASVIFLGEPLITNEMVDSEMAKNALGAIRAVLSLLYDITTTSFDMGLLPFTSAHILYQCARDLCRFMDIAEERGDLVSAAVFRSECEVFRTALGRQAERYPVASRQLKMLEEVLKAQATEPERKGLKERMLGCTREDIFDPQFGAANLKVETPTAQITSIPGSTAGTTPSSFSSASAGISWPAGLGTPSSVVFPPSPPLSKTSVPGGSGLFAGMGGLGGTGAGAGGVAVEGLAGSSFNDGGMNMDWFDVANYSWDAETLANMVKAAESTNAMFDIGTLGSVQG